MATTSKTGTPAAAALAGAIAFWLIYAGVRDVPVFEGLRQVLRRQQPIPTRTHAPFDAETSGSTLGAGAFSLGSEVLSRAAARGDKGVDKLVGNAAAAYPILKARFPSLVMYGWRATGSVPDSDHPRGMAIDVMTPSPLIHTQIIVTFLRLPGAKYWISQGQRASAATGWKMTPYTGPSPHTDHVHLSFT